MLGILAVALVTSAALVAPAPLEVPDSTRTAQALGRLGERRVFFGHQSVGANVLQGLARLSAAHGAPVRVTEIRGPGGQLSAGTFGHAYVGTNGDAFAKLREFGDALGVLQPSPDLAFVKFCWADFGPRADVEPLFRAYQERLADLTRRHPTTRFIHVTVPLTTVQSGPKAWVKRLLGRAPYGALENEAREAFNARLRAAYEGREPVFDLARLAARAPDGTEAAYTWQGRRTLALADAYTNDGGHLNPAGQDRVASALAAYLAALP